jgi:hypothetical protein
MDTITPRARTGRSASSRSRRWVDAVNRASEALRELEELQDDYQSWLDNLPDNHHGTILAEQLEAIVDVDLLTAIDIVSSAECIDLPRSFGRD